MQNAARTPWLVGPWPDLLLGCGVGYAAIFAALVFAGPEMRLAIPFALGPLVLLVTGTPHYGATLLRVYETRRDRRAYSFFSVWASAGIAALFVASLTAPLIGSLMLTLMLTWSPWHYSGQNYGIALMFLRRGGVPISPGLKRTIYASFFLSFLLTFLAVHGERPSGQYAPTGFGGSAYRFLPLGIPDDWRNLAMAICGVAYGVAIVTAAIGLLRVARLRQLAPTFVLAATQSLWFAVPTLARHYAVMQGVEPLGETHTAYAFMWVAVGHSVQYLWITHTYARRSQPAPAPGRSFYLGKCLLAGAAIWTVPALILAPGALGAVPYDLGLSALVSSAVNLHHFVLDGAIWKLRQGRVARVLIDSRVGHEPESRAPPSRLRLAPAIWAVGAASVLVILGATLETEYGFHRGLEAGDVARAEIAVERLTWMGRDSPSLHTNLAGLRAAQGDLDGALREVEKGLGIRPTPEAWRTKGWIENRRGATARALAAYQEALGLRPGWPPAANDVAWLRATSPEPILRDAGQAVELAEVSARATHFEGAVELDTLAAAYARAARFSAAVQMGERAADRARRSGDEALAAEIETRVTLYRSGQPYTDAVGPPAGPDPSRRVRFRLERRLQ